MNIAFIGGGHMAHALIAGMLSGRWQIQAAERNPRARARLRALQKRAPKKLAAAASLFDLDLQKAEAIVLAVRPPQMGEAAAQLSESMSKNKKSGGAVFISIAAGLCIADLRKMLPAGAAVVRAMPNIPSQAGMGLTSMCAAPKDRKAGGARAEKIFAATGEVEWLRREADMDAATALAGCAPAYFYLMTETAEKFAAKNGIGRGAARRIFLQAMRGAAAMMAREEPKALRTAMTPPGSATGRAVDELKARGFDSAFAAGLVAARNRARALGGGAKSKKKSR